MKSMKAILVIALLSITSCTSISKQSKDSFVLTTPDKAGYSQEKLEALRKHLIKSDSSSLLLLHDGKVFFEWGDIHKKHLIHSMRKPLLSALFGLLYDEGKLPLNKTLEKLGIQDHPTKLNQTELQATLDMVLKSRSGVYLDATAESQWMKDTKPKRGTYNPGEYHYYNNWDFNVAGFIYEMLSGSKIYDDFNEFFAKPLGMKHYQNQYSVLNEDYTGAIPKNDGFYQYEKSKSKFPAYTFRMSAHDLALFAQLYLNKGVWNGKRILSEEWINLSTREYSKTNPEFGLGYGMFWSTVNSKGSTQGSFYHTGAGKHMIAIYPKHKLIMIHRVDTENPDNKFQNHYIYPIINGVHDARL